MKRIVLTAAEIESLLQAAGEGGEGYACFECAPDPAAAEKAYESGMAKLRTLLARRTAVTVSGGA